MKYSFKRTAAAALAAILLAGASAVQVSAAELKPDDNNIALHARVSVSSVYFNMDDHSGARLNDGDLGHLSRWAVESADGAWCEYDFGYAAVFSGVKIYEDTVYGERITGYTAEYFDGTDWRTVTGINERVTSGTDSSDRSYRLFSLQFAPVTSDKLRISFTASGGPAVREVEVIAADESLSPDMIYLDGAPLDGYQSDRFEYDVVIPKDGKIPTVSAKDCAVIQAEDKNSSAEVTVSAGQLTNTYTINFSEDEGQMLNKVIDAHKFSEKSGAVQNTLAPDGSSVGQFEAGGYIKYSGFDFAAGEGRVFMTVASSAADGKLELRIDSPDGEIIGTLSVNSTGSVTLFNEQYANIKQVSGVHDLYITAEKELPVSLDTFVISTYSGSETKEEKDERMSWWRNARYGQFIHFGGYANFPFSDDFKGYGEWVMFNDKISRTEYEDKAIKTFNPADFDAKTIVSNAKSAGVNYMVFTSKHHEGFSMYDTDIKNFAPFDIMDYGNYKGEDPIGSLAEECRKAGIVFGCYYSIMDWHHPAQNTLGETVNDKAAYIADMKAQLRELIQKYDVDMLWFDGEWHDWWTTTDGDALYKYLRTLKPSLIINNRVGKRSETDGDFGTPEQEIPATGLDYDWESCITMNNSWGYVACDTNWKSVDWIIESLVSTASKGGNMLLNVGPDNNGVVPQECTDRLSKAGEWIKKYGESIFGTTANPFSTPLTFGAATKKDGYLYLHITNYPEDGRIIMPAIENKIRSVKILGEDEALKYTAGKGFVLIDMPETPDNEYDTVVAVEVEGVPVQSEDSYLSENLAKGKTAAATSVYFNDSSYGADKAVDGSSSTRWASDDGVTSAQLTIDFGEAVSFNMVMLDECVSWGERIGRFAIEYLKDGQWETAAECDGMGSSKTVIFDEVTAEQLRINIKSVAENAAGGPTVNEIQVYRIDLSVSEVLKGDVDGNGEVNVADILSLKNLIMSGSWSAEYLGRGDMNDDGTLNVGDILAIKNVIMNGQ